MKRYAEEPGGSALEDRADLIVSRITRVEVPSALWRKYRQRELAKDDLVTLLAAFESDWVRAGDENGSFQIIELSHGILELAASSLSRHSLRAYDALHLASAIAAREVDDGVTEFACFDRHLRDAAAAEGFDVLPAAAPRRSRAEADR